ncbi:metal-sensing transcriptional repressor [Loigolactobacillus bifermentans]|uniref:Uncharacterized protein n=1 Tax=Loigolactobacillus bifermentans DSM 20003 TaxID=1423726 RepID=A0A0R1GHA4_9LACO|nr:metal-sensing transcriptional repressor [Loigolactobacillus bifermentans]KRK33413.1 hypothetical protein FC07_GL001174 [Loigolactobacillus bifermentans DSM 20003]QGG61405.1 metal-sensing transcriptional repressor [Loigolactobacillus bifermentans]
MAYDPKLITRLRRAEGQLRGIQKMIATERASQDVLIQLTAVEASVQKVMKLLVAADIEKQLTEPPTEELTAALNLIDKL